MSERRAPAWVVTLNGAAAAGVIEASVTQGAHNGAERFSVLLAVPGTDRWVGADALAVTVAVSLGGVVTRLADGVVDTVAIDPVGGTVRIEGRGYAAALIEARTRETFSNRTSSEIAALLAARHGLAADVMATTTPVGRYYQAQHDRITLDQFSRATTEWDLLLFLAEREGFEVSVTGRTLRFAPPPPADAPVVLTQGMTTALRLERTLTLARDIEVTVKSWNSAQNRAFAETARGSAGSGGTPQRYVLVRPNLTPAQALALAQAQLAIISRHERVVVVTMPGDPVFAARVPVALTGTGTGFDRTYAVDAVTFTLSATRGFTQVLRLLTPVAAQATTPSAPVP